MSSRGTPLPIFFIFQALTSFLKAMNAVLHVENLKKKALKAYSGLWREFASFATDLSQPGCPGLPALVELFLVWLDLAGRGSRAKAALGAISHLHCQVQGGSDWQGDGDLH